MAAPTRKYSTLSNLFTYPSTKVRNIQPLLKNQKLRSSIVIHNVISSTSGAVEIPALLQGQIPPIAEEPNRGTMNYSKPPVAVFAGALYGDEEIDEMRQASQEFSSIPWLKMDKSVPRPPLGPGYAEHVVERIKTCMKKIEAEGRLEQDGLWLY